MPPLSRASHHSQPQLTGSALGTAGWDQIGDDDELYIQSDDHRLSSHAATLRPPPAPTFDSSVGDAHPPQQPRKRKRPTLAYQSGSRDSQQPMPSSSHYPSSSQENLWPGRPPNALSAPKRARQAPKPPSKTALKFDSEGCANCRTNQSKCWWRKKRLVRDHNGHQAWTEDKLCNTCSIYWNKNGFHRTVPPKARKRTECKLPPPPPPLRIGPSPCPSSRPSKSLARVSSASRGSTIGLSSPLLPLAKLPAPPSKIVPLRRERSPSQLARTAEREAHILKRKITCKADEAHSSVANRGDPFHHIDCSLAPSPLLPSQTSTVEKSLIDLSRQSSADHDEFAMTKRMLDAFLSQPLRPLDPKLSATSSEMDFFSEYVLEEPTDQSDQVFDFFNLSQPASAATAPIRSDHLSNSGLGPSLSPPRTPPSQRTQPSNARNHASKPAGSPLGSPSFDLNHLLSPSFLNASPNSLLNKLNPDRLDTAPPEISFTIIPSAGPLAGSEPFVDCENIFLSSSVSHLPSELLAPPSPSHGEPSKRVKRMGKCRGPDRETTLAFPWDLHPTSSSATSTKSCIFPGAKLSSAIARSGNRSDPTRDLGMVAGRSEKDIQSPTHAEQVSRQPPPRKPRRQKQPSRSKGGLAECAPSAAMPHNSVQPTFFGSSQLLEHYRSESSQEHAFGRIGGPSHLQTPSKYPIARTIWSRPLGPSGLLSSDDAGTQPKEHTRTRIRHPLRSSPSISEGEPTSRFYTASSTIATHEARTTALSSMIRHGFRSDPPLSSELMMDAEPSSPPVLPPPSDCSEGITPLSPGLFSDDADDLSEDGMGMVEVQELDKMKHDIRAKATAAGGRDCSSATGMALNDITSSLNEPQSVHHGVNRSAPGTESTNNEIGSLSPQIMAAFREAIKAGWTPEDLAQALRSINTSRSGDGGECKLGSSSRADVCG
ncbi:hypothetical protein CROQUDRAFT_100798 [Cronartium quercuum f. sp. fusiforme G11]|uniref:GATA-type domain-containing protein n=1 Tax=Cronartium quercuum f. sp. fusiforme G11 TaxID=708437 RepID=A0A9P6T5Q4_9BASI|nr:hypothetical protein CROQUDRAFT_100798 [Cronartium quercuum f. sp. fusiforme G11]